jgi:uncharacterized protein YidB (DUF937 family)
MKRLLVLTVLTVGLGIGIAAGNASPTLGDLLAATLMSDVPTGPMVLGTVHIPKAVKADDQPLRPGTYTVRTMGEALKPAVGETPNLEQWVEFLQNGSVKGKAVASVVPPDQIQQVADGSVPRPGSPRVQLLKGDDYVRVWINKGGTNYLIHLPTISQ